MNPVAQKYGASGFPEVNLLPKEIDQRRIMRVVQVGSVVGVLAVIALLALAYVGALASKSVVQGQLEDVFEKEDAAVKERDEKASVFNEFARREQQEYALLAIGWGETDFASALTATLAQDNPEVALIRFDYMGPNVVSVGGEKVDPTLGGGIGRFNFTYTARTYEEALAYADRLEAVPGIAKVFATNQRFGADHGIDYWTVEGSAVITDAYLTRRLIPENGLFAQSLWEEFIQATIAESLVSDGAVSEPTPEPTPTPSEEAEEE